MVEFAKDPPTPEGLLTKFDLRDTWCDPDLALAIRDDGLAEWWPNWHPELERKLTPEERYRWFMETMTDELRSAAETLFTADVAFRRRIIARSLIELQTMFEIEHSPPPDFIEPGPRLSRIPNDRNDPA